MTLKLAHISILVDDYDKAIQYYTQVLGFKLMQDTPLSETKRWVLVSPGGDNGCHLLLAKAATDFQKASIGNQSGGRVFLFLHTDNFEHDYHRLQKHQVKIIRGPITEPYDQELVFEDLYGDLWDLIAPTS